MYRVAEREMMWEGVKYNGPLNNLGLLRLFQLTRVVQFIRIVQLSDVVQTCLVQGSSTLGLRNQVGRGRMVVICEFSAV